MPFFIENQLMETLTKVFFFPIDYSMQKHLQSLARDTSQLYASQLIGMAIAFGISILVARTLGADGRGAYAWITSLLFVGIQLGQFGVDLLNRRLGATHPELAPVLAGNSLLQIFTWGSISAAILFVFGLFQPIGQAYPFALFLGLLALPCSLFLGLFGSLATGLGHARVLAISELLQRISMAVLVLFFLLFIGLEVWHLMFASFLTAGLMGVYLLKKLKRIIQKPLRVDLSLIKSYKWLIIGAFGSAMGTHLLVRIDMLMLGAWRPLAETGYYAIAQSLLDALLVLPGLLAFLILPKLAAEKEQGVRKKLLITVLGIVVVGFSCVAFIFYFLAPWGVPFIFGEEFIPASVIFQRLLIAGVFLAAFQVCQNAVAGYGFARYLIIAPAVGLGIKFILGIFFIPEFGIMAAANIAIVAYACSFLIALILALLKQNIQKK